MEGESEKIRISESVTMPNQVTYVAYGRRLEKQYENNVYLYYNSEFKNTNAWLSSHNYYLPDMK
jgi:hypothetical protein